MVIQSLPDCPADLAPTRPGNQTRARVEPIARVDLRGEPQRSGLHTRNLEVPTPDLTGSPLKSGRGAAARPARRQARPPGDVPLAVPGDVPIVCSTRRRTDRLRYPATYRSSAVPGDVPIVCGSRRRTGVRYPATYRLRYVATCRQAYAGLGLGSSSSVGVSWGARRSPLGHFGSARWSALPVGGTPCRPGSPRRPSGRRTRCAAGSSAAGSGRRTPAR
jgi:hypothetical protein